MATGVHPCQYSVVSTHASTVCDDHIAWGPSSPPLRLPYQHLCRSSSHASLHIHQLTRIHSWIMQSLIDMHSLIDNDNGDADTDYVPMFMFAWLEVFFLLYILCVISFLFIIDCWLKSNLPLSIIRPLSYSTASSCAKHMSDNITPSSQEMN